VWSVWSKKITLQLGAGRSTLQGAGFAALEITHPASLPLDRVLQRITDAVHADKPNVPPPLRGAKLHILVDDSICPPIRFEIPVGVQNWHELSTLAHAWVAQQWGSPVQDVQCQWDASQPNIQAALPKLWLNTLQTWANHQHLKITAITPLWAGPANQHINFVPQTYWRAPWLMAALVVLAMAATSAIKLRQSQRDQRALSQTLATLRAQPVAANTVAAPLGNPRLEYSRQAAHGLQTNLNNVFTLVENVKEPSVRLRNLSLDNASDAVRLEYELDSLPRASSITLALNAGYDYSPWRLESISAINGLQAASTQFRALWSANIGKL
jgi:hypothetical protein